MSETVGTIKEIWRYPVSSIGGEYLDTASVGDTGIDGDRTHLLVDLDTGEVASPETTPRWRPALMLSACRSGNDVLVSSSTWRMEQIGPSLDAALSEYMGFRCGVRPKGAFLEGYGSEALNLQPRYGLAPLHFLTTKSLSALALLLPGSMIDHRRFRPNIVFETESHEEDWLGRGWACASVRGTVTERTKRCGLTMVAQPGLPEEPEILRTIVRQRARCLGVYASVTRAGKLSVGDNIVLS
ncbi:MOSC domain-containing protein (plasmid) [Aliirhizobium terrae]|uniref:MOSC domain-containing protein n=1 Tax=Terrirhizobium terrae TaxID=2926709 RepID=UPI002575D34F|nr:MOSC domain-containing protein [Rhizobium sp. CC-CFT758]WJH38470.1 MOSC domain-containing protein [Rhizobium sp. CC-CFT758]